MKKILFLLFLLFSLSLFSQSKFSKLSRPEKCWVLTHPFVAKKAMFASKHVLTVTDSISKLGVIGNDNNGGKLDAFKHAYWMVYLSLKIGSNKAMKLGKAHEKGNSLQWKKKMLEDSILPDSVSSEMDMKNNLEGIRIYNDCRHIHFKSELIDKTLQELAEGKLYIIKKDANKNYLTFDNQLIRLNEWKGKWSIPKCIITSNQ
jgi:hypothetical protein